MYDMRNGDFIRSMNNEQLCNFLFVWGINTAVSFLKHGGTKIMDAKQLAEWIDKEDFVCEQTKVGEDFLFGQNFKRKEQQDA